METKTQIVLTKQVLNNFIVKKRGAIRQARCHVCSKNVRKAKKLRQQKSSNEQENEKRIRKADKLIEELKVLKNIYDDDLLKFALLNKKSIIEVANDVNSTIEERALCRVATWKTLLPEINKFREQYLDWEEKVPHLLKSIGLQHRKKRLMRLEVKGQKEHFLKKENYGMAILQKLIDFKVDPRIAKASALMKASEKDCNAQKSEDDDKKRNKHQKDTQRMEELDENDDEDNIPDSCREKDVSEIEDDKDGDLIEVHIKKKNKPRKREQETVNQDEDSRDDAEDEDSRDDAEDEDSDEDSIYDSESDEGDTVSDMDTKNREENGSSDDDSAEIYSDNESVVSERSLESAQTLLGRENECEVQEKSGKAIVQKKSKKSTVLKDEDQVKSSKKKKRKLKENSISDSDGIASSEIESENEVTGKANIQRKKTKKTTVFRSKDKLKSSKKKKKRKLEEDDILDSDEMSISGSDGISSSGIESETEFTSIWDHCKDKKKKKGDKISTEKKFKFAPVNVNMFMGNTKVKNKGTVEIRQLDLTDQSCIDASFKGNDGLVVADSEEDDFFVRDTGLKKKKKQKQTKTEGDVTDSNEDEEAADENGESGSDDEISARERYLDKNFKRIWGRGMEEQFQVALGRGGVRSRGGGRGNGFDRFSGQNRSFGSNYSSERPNTNRSPSGKDFGNANMIPVSSDWRNKASSEKKYSNANMLPVASDWKDRGMSEQERGDYNKRNISGYGGESNYNNRFGSRTSDQAKPGWKRGRFEKRDHNNPNRTPVSGDWRENSVQKDSSQSSLLHPSWLAKLKQREMASCINQFQGKVKTFDLDD